MVGLSEVECIIGRCWWLGLCFLLVVIIAYSGGWCMVLVTVVVGSSGGM